MLHKTLISNNKVWAWTTGAFNAFCYISEQCYLDYTTSVDREKIWDFDKKQENLPRIKIKKKLTRSKTESLIFLCLKAMASEEMLWGPND